MAYKLLYHPAVLKEDLRRIPTSQKSRIRHAIEIKLINNPILAGRPLRQSLKGHRRLRVGDWRIIYRIDKEDIIILKIGHRREVYRHAARRTKE